MKVTKQGSTNEAGATRKKGPKSNTGEAFADSLKGLQESSGSAPAVESGRVGNVDSVFAVQEVPDALDQRTRKMAMDYGEDLLSRLDDLKVGVLNGCFSKDKLTELAHNLRQKRQSSDDEKLNDLIGEIELRAEVEIAKLSRRRKTLP